MQSYSVLWHAGNVTIMGVQYPLYAHVHHGYGLNDAFDRSVALLLASPAAARAGHGVHGTALNRAWKPMHICPKEA